MKILFNSFIFLLFFNSLNSYCQEKQRLSRAYIGGQLHQDQPGFSLTNSFGINRYIGVGAGIDITSYSKKLLVPVYLDFRGRYNIERWEPFILTQFGKQLYNDAGRDVRPDLTGAAVITDFNKRGNYFYGIGAGAGYILSRTSFFLSYTFRSYSYKYHTSRRQGDMVVKFPNETTNANILTAGLVF